MKTQNLLTPLSDISYIAGEMKFFSGDSRADISEFILWAQEFEKLHSKTNWHEEDYILTVTEFTEQKIKGAVTFPID